MTAKTLLLDIETAPLTTHNWGLFKQFISLPQILESDYVICFSAKWYGLSKSKSKIFFFSIWNEGNERMVQNAWELLDEADIVVGYNSSDFDIPWLNRTFWLNDLTPPSPFKQVDLLKTVRKQFRFPSNKLEHILHEKGLPNKISHGEGHWLWRKVLEGDDKARRTMQKYNVQDVAAMEPLYTSLLPWISGHPNANLFAGEGCTSCGSDDYQKRGFVRLLVGKYQQYSCNTCGRWFRGNKRIEGSEFIEVAR